MQIETARLVIREFVLDDLDAVHQILDLDLKMETCSYQERQHWLHWAILNYRELERLHQPPYGDRAIVLKDTNTLIGACGLVPALEPFGQLPYCSTRLGLPTDRRFTPEVGLFWAVSSAYQRQGYATEAGQGLIDWAFEALHLKRIIAETGYDNAGSIGVMRRLGMTIEQNPYPDPFWFQVVGILENPAG